MGKGQSFVNHEKWSASTSIIETLKTINHKELGQISLIRVKILTGRMHQIRVHCAHIGNPVLWDIMYGSKTHNDILARSCSIKRQLLHSYQYGFESIWGEHIERQCPPPQEFAFLGLNI
jgi:23S rRNA-/tRNA-specific pseudouridylate synthase